MTAPFDLEHDEQLALAEAYDAGLDAVYRWACDTIRDHRDEAAAMADMSTPAPGRHGGVTP